jgi:hypothetical protein
MMVEAAGDEMFFQTITDKGQTIDSGVVKKGTDNRVVGTAGRGAAPKPAAPAGAKPASPAPAKPAPAAPAKPAAPNPR